MKKNKFFEGKKPAQAMVEFAIALPILLLLLYGILEAGRLLFLSSTDVTASRQAARYGATTGEGLNGHPRYQDCLGIRQAADKVGFLGDFQTIALAYDGGPGTTETSYCTGVDSDPSLTTTILEGNRTRLVVTVTQPFTPLVRLVPFGPRDITASSARTILYSVPIVVEQEQQEWDKTPTTLTITSDTPDPSEVNQAVLVSVHLEDDSAAPIAGALVEISGADVNCANPITTDGNGNGSCTVIFSNASTPGNPFVLTAIYNGDDDYLGSSDSEDHEVTLIKKEISIRSHDPNPSIRDQQFVVVVDVTSLSGAVTPTGTVQIDGGQGVRCTITLSNGVGSCPLSYNNAGDKTLTATYVPDNGLFEPGQPVFVIHKVAEFTPTPTWTPLPPTFTPVPTQTPLPTPTYTPTTIPTPASCNLVGHGPISLAGGLMSMTISNPYPFPIVMKDVTVTWNHDKGSNDGNKKLSLTQVAVGPDIIWTGLVDKTNIHTIPTTAIIPAAIPPTPSTTTITFYFHQPYDNLDTYEHIYINLSTPGCESTPIDSSR